MSVVPFLLSCSLECEVLNLTSLPFLPFLLDSVIFHHFLLNLTVHEALVFLFLAVAPAMKTTQSACLYCLLLGIISVIIQDVKPYHSPICEDLTNLNMHYIKKILVFIHFFITSLLHQFQVHKLVCQ